MNNKEIERRFLLAALPDGALKHSVIHQGYLAVGSDNHEVRLRHEECEDRQYSLAAKIGHGKEREQYEIKLDWRQFNELWPATAGRRLHKRRYRMPYGSFTIEVDQYIGDLQGLIVAEVEFSDINICNGFVPLEWFGTELTNRPEYSNHNLACHGLPSTFSADLAEMKFAKADEAGLNELAKKIVKRFNDRSGERLIVLIAGGSASGKTTRARQLAERLSRYTVLISMDDYFKGVEFMEEQRALGNWLCWDQPEAVDLDLLARHLAELKTGKPINKPRYDFSSGSRIGWELLRPKPIIIVEGLFVLDSPVVDKGDFKIFIAAGTHGRVIRRLLRDVAEREQKPADVLRYFAEVVEPMHRQHVEKTKAKADLVIDGDYRPEVEAGHFCTLDRQVKFNFGYDSLDPRLPSLKQIGSVRKQQDFYYNPLGRSLARTGEVLRVRRENGKRTLAYKGPKAGPRGAGTPTLDRQKFECEIDEATERALHTLYRGNVKVIEKNRTLYNYRGLLFTHDCLFFDLGKSYYLEFRFGNKTSDEKKFVQLLARLGLDRKDSITKSYLELV